MSFKEIDNKTLKGLHDVELEILKEFNRICEKHKLNYFAVGGTLIGTIKYQSFIPWDDDVDLGMPREDYDKFIEIAKKELDSKYFIQSGYDYKNNWVPFTKIRKKNTLANEESINHIDYPKGIFIDIFPYDKVSSNNSFLFKLKGNIVRITMDTISYKWKTKKLSQLRRKNLCRLFSILPIKWLSKIQLNLMTNENKKDCKYMTSYCGAYTLFKETHLIETLIPQKKKNFEDMKINVPNDYDRFLTQIYGDYRKDPPKEKRVNHAMLEISFDVEKDKNKK